MNKKPLIAYIEDDDLLMNMYRHLFTVHGFAFAGAKDFEAGQELVDKQKPDLLLLDLLLPTKAKWLPTDINVNLGLELLAKIKADPKNKNTPVIVLSNLDESEVVAEAKKRGADDYIIKAEVLPKDVLKRVREILKSKGVDLPVDPKFKESENNGAS